MLPIEIAEDIGNRALKLYDDGLPRGSSTGWRGLDELYTVAVQQWTLITGIPGSGKSEWLDALMMNLAEESDWDFAIYSPENFPTETHLAKLAEKHLRKPFGRGPTERMTRDELDGAACWICDHFVWLKPEYKDHISLLEAAQRFCRTKRRFGVVLDPWNTLEHFRPKNLTETEYVSQALTDITNWCRERHCHIFVVAHPAKMPRDAATGKRAIPTPYDIAGSAHWYNKADNIVTVHRDQVDKSQLVEIHVQKVRFKNCGRVGLADLYYDRVTGRYHERAPLHIVAQYQD